MQVKMGNDLKSALWKKNTIFINKFENAMLCFRFKQHVNNSAS